MPFVVEEEDSVRLYPACEQCSKKVLRLTESDAPPWPEVEVYIV